MATTVNFLVKRYATVAVTRATADVHRNQQGELESALEMFGLNRAVYQISSVSGMPAVLPEILKDFAKAAIRTQPNDILSWSRDYFHSLAGGIAAPEKDRWEDPATGDSRSGITTGTLRLIHKQVRTCYDLFLFDLLCLFCTRLLLGRRTACT